MNTSLPERTFILAVLLAVGSPSVQASVKVGDTFPDLAEQKLEGQTPTSLKGKAVLVDFWASWCGPCAASFPVMEDLHNRYKERGLVIIAISVDDKAADMQMFLKKHAVSFTILRDAGHRLVSVVDVQTMPTSFILDGDGKVRFLHNGFRGEATKKQYAAEIESLLGAAP